MGTEEGSQPPEGFTSLEEQERAASRMSEEGTKLYPAVEMSQIPSVQQIPDEDAKEPADSLVRELTPEPTENGNETKGEHENGVNGSSGTDTTAVPVQTVSNSEDESAKEQKPMLEENNAALIRSLHLFAFLLIPAAFFMFAFTEMGFGATVFKMLAGNSSATLVAGLGMFLFCVLYLLDVFWWQGGALRVLRLVLLSVCGVCILMAVCLTFRTRPYAPILGFFVVFTFYCAMLYMRFFSTKIHVVNFMHSLSMALLAIAFIGIAWGLVWAGAEEFWWDEDTRAEFRNRLRVCEDMDTGEGKHCQSYGAGGNGVSCPPGCPEVEAESACAMTEEHCLAAFLLWGSQFVASTLIIIIGGSMYFISKSLIDHQGEAKVSPVAKLYGYGVFVFMFLIWVASSIGGAAMQLSSVVSAFAVTGLGLLFCLIGVSLGRSGLNKISEHKTTKKLLALRQSDWVKGLGMITVAPLVPLLLVVSMLNQALRMSCLGGMMRQMTEEERKGLLTPFGAKMVKAAQNWNWSSVLRKAIIIGFAYVVFQVGISRFTTVFLAWLNLKLSSVNIWALSVIIFFVGMTLFLIPAVPGLPVYLTNGVTLGAAGQRQWGSTDDPNDNTGFWIAMAWGVVVASITKLAACWFQQKIIGQRMGDWISVRATVDVNSSAVKAIRVILQRPGMNRDKVLILIGGPDWPTSVLTGILKQSYINMMLGTLPILLPIALTVIAGGCQLKRSEGGAWESISGLFLALSAATFGGALVAALLAIERCARANQEALAAIPDDEEVKVYQQAQVEKLAKFKAATAWHRVPTFGKVALWVAWACCYLSVILFYSWSAECFETVELTDNYNDPPLNGNVLNLVKMPTGGGALALHIFSLAIFYGFGTWAEASAKNLHVEEGTLDDDKPKAVEEEAQVAKTVAGLPA